MGILPEMMAPAPSTDAFILAALGDRMLSTDPAIKSAFDVKVATDPGFAASPDARLAWFYPYAGPGPPYPLRYPIARELD